MLKKNHFLVTIMSWALGSLLFIGCSDDDTPNPTGEPDGTENKTTGYVLTGTTSSDTALALYVEELPEGGVVDLSQGQDFPRFFPLTTFDNALYLARPDQGAGFSKYVVNANGELELEGNINTVDASSFRIAIRDRQTGVFQDRNTPDIISVFNPETLEVTGNIDMSQGFVPNDIPQRYQNFFFRGDDVFAPIRGNNGTTFTSFIVHQANLSSNTFVGDTQREGNMVSSIESIGNYGQSFVDEQGTLYIPDAGNYEGTGIGGRVNRILQGSNEFDTSYTFEPALVLNPQNVFLPNITDFTYIGNGKALAGVNAETPQEAIDIVQNAGGVQNLTPEQVQQVLGILFSAETARWCVLDLQAETVTPIPNVPSVSAFPSGNIVKDGADYLLPVANSSENAYYRFSVATNTAAKAFDVTGASISGAFNIANNNE